jgi:2-keto-4-pentenoate hydratase
MEDRGMSAHAQAFELLRQLHEKDRRCDRLPEDCAPRSRAEGYAIQALIETRSAQPLAAWKIAATSLAGQKHIGVDGPLAGRYIAERIIAPGGIIPFGDNHMRVAEVEFAFRLGADIEPRDAPYTEDEVFSAVASLHPAIEIPDSRYEHFEKVGAAQLIADNACAHWLVIGEGAPESWRDLDLSAYQPMGRIAGKGEWQGLGANVLGSPRSAMTWLVNELSGLGITATAGQYVSTGTCLMPMKIAAGDHVVGDFGALGRVDVSLA